MKELSIEEKAKAYDEAIKIAKSKIKNDKDHVLYEDDVIEIFPELAESKDEKIRQFLIHEVTETSDKIMSYRNMNKKDVLAWLEKQGEQKETLCDKCKKAQPSHSCQDITELGRCAVEHEQKPADKVEPKSAWSEEDERIRKWLICTLKSLNNSPVQIDDAYEMMLPAIDWLKSIKERVLPQPKHEWSEEDEEMYKEVLTDIIYAKNNLEVKECLGLSKGAMEAFNWFSKRYKSLRPQSHWKPSDEQIYELSKAIDYYTSHGFPNRIMCELFEQLKKL